MLPLVQMHQMVQTPPHLDPLASFQNHLKPSDYLPIHYPSRPTRVAHSYQSGGDSPLRAFPIRSSQPAAQSVQHRITASISHHASEHTEHRLRRKTPNGTIDAGYDGTPTQLAAGPPPLKHMILPASRKIFPTAIVQHGSQSSSNGHQMTASNGSWLYPSSSPNSAGGDGFGTPDQQHPAFGGWGHGKDTSFGSDPSLMEQTALLQTFPQHTYNHAMRMQTGLGHGYQQPGDFPIFSPGGFSPSLMWGDAGLSPGSLASTGYVPHNNPYESAFASVQAPLHQGALGGHSFGHGHPFRMPMSAYSLDDGFSHQHQISPMLQSPHRRMESLSLGPSTPTGGAPSPARFKERALAHAHKTYADLLIYLSHAKKAQAKASSSSGSKVSSKMVVFPRPPKQLSTNLSPRVQKIPPSVTGASTGYPEVSAQVSFAARMVNSYAAARSRDGLPSSRLNEDVRPVNNHPAVMAEIFGNPAGHNKYSYFSKPQQRHPFSHTISSPLANAKQSLDILSNLCEQSGWKWVDGMLLGGCLHYGLEHYEEALEWFRRIINLESR